MDPDFDKINFGKLHFEDGSRYEGDVFNGVPHGEGTMLYPDGTTETCKWIYGLPVKGERDERIPNIKNDDSDRFIVNGHTFCLGFGYKNDSISSAFSINSYIQGIRFYRDNCVLFVVDDTYYKDGCDWEKDKDGEPIFVYTGRGKIGNQDWCRENAFLRDSADKRVVLFIKRKPNEYVFHGQVAVKRIETAVEKDITRTDRTVFKFILRRLQ